MVLENNSIHTTIFSANGMEEKRNILKKLSEQAKMLLELDPSLGDKVNEIIINLIYKNEEHQEFDTFNGWKKKGFKVKKGSKAFFIWSKPRKISKSEDAKETKDPTEDEKTIKMYGIAHLFSNAQIEEL